MGGIVGDDDLSAEAIVAALGDAPPFGDPLQVFPYAVSTEALALGWARQQNAPEGALVVADVELAGRGRRGIVWTSVPGRSLAFSVVLRPALPVEGEGLLWLLASLAVAEGLADVAGVPARLKWPNDVLVGGRRLGVVKVDAQLGPGRIDAAVVTARMNVALSEEDFPPELRGSVTSLALEDAPRSRADVLAAILRRLAARYASSVPELLEAYRDCCETLGTPIRAQLMPTGEALGQAVDVDERGGLVVTTASGKGVLAVDLVKRLHPG